MKDCNCIFCKMCIRDRRNRETLLMYYFLEMNNEEIAKKQNISRSGVFQNRHNSLALMKKLLKEKQ